jgi:hypothetical protein
MPYSGMRRANLDLYSAVQFIRGFDAFSVNKNPVIMKNIATVVWPSWFSSGLVLHCHEPVAK